MTNAIYEELSALMDKMQKAIEVRTHEGYAAMYLALYGMPMLDFGVDTEDFRAKMQAVRASTYEFIDAGSPADAVREQAIKDAIQRLDEMIGGYLALKNRAEGTN